MTYVPPCVNASNTVTHPSAGEALASVSVGDYYNALYQVSVYAYLSGVLTGLTDADNLELKYRSTVIATIPLIPAVLNANSVPFTTWFYTADTESGGEFTVNAIAAGSVLATYHINIVAVEVN